jgi:hypothetical protein
MKCLYYAFPFHVFLMSGFLFFPIQMNMSENVLADRNHLTRAFNPNGAGGYMRGVFLNPGRVSRKRLFLLTRCLRKPPGRDSTSRQPWKGPIATCRVGSSQNRRNRRVGFSKSGGRRLHQQRYLGLESKRNFFLKTLTQ